MALPSRRLPGTRPHQGGGIENFQSVRQFIRNGKVYGKKGYYNIYVNDVKVMLSDIDAEEILNAQKKENEIQESKKAALNFCKQAYSYINEKKDVNWQTLKKDSVTVQDIRAYLIEADGEDEESYNAKLTDEDIQNFINGR